MSTEPSNRWHVSTDDLAAYGRGDVHGVAADSIEAHLLSCAACRDGLSASRGAPVESEARWAAIADAIDTGSRWNRTSPWIRLVAGTPQLALAGLGLAVAFIAFPLLLRSVVDERASVTWFLAVAPAVLLGGVVLAYRKTADPAGALADATPMHSFRIVVARACSLSLVLLPAGVLTAALLPARTALLLGWVLPAVACSAVALAVGTRYDPLVVAGTLSAGWAVVVLTGMARLRTEPVASALEELAVNEAAVQGTAMGITLVAVAVLLLRRDDLSYGAAPR